MIDDRTLLDRMEKALDEDEEATMTEINPLKWKREHRAGLAVASAAGAAVGIAIGFARTRYYEGFSRWLAADTASALIWAIIGALVVGATIYCYRVFSN